MYHALQVFLLEIFRHWIALVTGSVVSLGMLVWEKRAKKDVSWKAIVVVFLVGLALSIFFAWQDEFTSAEWRLDALTKSNEAAQREQDQIQQLQLALMQKDRPVVLQQQTDPDLKALIERQDAQLTNLRNEIQSPRKKALQLSNDILKFVSDRLKVEPPIPITKGASKGQTFQIPEGFLGWVNETASEYRERFLGRIADVRQDSKAAGLDPNQLEKQLEWCEQPTFVNVISIQQCGVSIGALAQKLPQ